MNTKTIIHTSKKFPRKVLLSAATLSGFPWVPSQVDCQPKVWATANKTNLNKRLKHQTQRVFHPAKRVLRPTSQTAIITTLLGGLLSSLTMFNKVKLKINWAVRLSSPSLVSPSNLRAMTQIQTLKTRGLIIATLCSRPTIIYAFLGTRKTVTQQALTLRHRAKARRTLKSPSLTSIRF